MRKKAKHKTFSVEKSDIRNSFPFFWKTCIGCKDRIRLENMWVTGVRTNLNTSLPNLNKKYICTDCASTKAESCRLIMSLRNGSIKRPPPSPKPINPPKKL